MARTGGKPVLGVGHQVDLNLDRGGRHGEKGLDGLHFLDNLDVSLSAAVVASWARYAEGVDESGDPIPVVDNLKSDLMARASLNRTDPLAFLRSTALFGNLADREGFTTPYTRTLSSLHTKGARETLTELLSQTT